jgi:hypothetical protein
MDDVGFVSKNRSSHRSDTPKESLDQRLGYLKMPARLARTRIEQQVRVLVPEFHYSVDCMANSSLIALGDMKNP